ncbi:MAG: hypothetical protein PSV24_16455 [Rhodoferax sp.]|nr:hypothetical protein [Rhodoferax sp.]
MSSTEQVTTVTAPAKVVAALVVKTPAKRAIRPAVKKAVRPAAKKVSAPAAPAATAVAPLVPKSDKQLKSKKSKKVHEDFSLPMLEYLMLETLKLRSSKLGRPAKKNVIVRAGIKALAAMSDASFLAVLKTVPSNKATSDSKE